MPLHRAPGGLKVLPAFSRNQVSLPHPVSQSRTHDLRTKLGVDGFLIVPFQVPDLMHEGRQRVKRVYRHLLRCSKRRPAPLCSTGTRDSSHTTESPPVLHLGGSTQDTKSCCAASRPFEPLHNAGTTRKSRMLCSWRNRCGHPLRLRSECESPMSESLIMNGHGWSW